VNISDTPQIKRCQACLNKGNILIMW